MCGSKVSEQFACKAGGGVFELVVMLGSRGVDWKH